VGKSTDRWPPTCSAPAPRPSCGSRCHSRRCRPARRLLRHPPRQPQPCARAGRGGRSAANGQACGVEYVARPGGRGIRTRQHAGLSTRPDELPSCAAFAIAYHWYVVNPPHGFPHEPSPTNRRPRTREARKRKHMFEKGASADSPFVCRRRSGRSLLYSAGQF